MGCCFLPVKVAPELVGEKQLVDDKSGGVFVQVLHHAVLVLLLAGLQNSLPVNLIPSCIFTHQNLFEYVP